MDSLTILIFNLINFLIVCAVLYRIVGSALGNYFFARHTNVRKQMLTAVMTLRQARARAARSKERYDELPGDIEARRQAIGDSCHKECAQILEEARHKAEHMLRAGERRAADERRRHAALLRERLMRAAFALAEERIKKGANAAMQKKYAQQGVAELRQVALSECSGGKAS